MGSGAPSRGLTVGVARWLLVGCVSLAGCGSTPVDQGPSRVPLRQLAAAQGLDIGSAADRSFHLTGTEGDTFRTLLADEFSELTPENDMKHERLQPSRGVYDFTRADALVDFAEAHGMLVRGHTLAWHRQLATWLTTGSWTPAQADSLLREHITTVVGHYRGRIAAWDVVNEALADDGSLRSGFWLDQVGPAYIERAFQWARAADSAVALFYNDYGLEWPGAKADSAYALLDDLRRRGVPVDGIGFEAHFVVGQVPAEDDLVATFARFAALGLEVHVTELDVRLPLPASDASLETQARDYATVVGACLRVPACETVVLWGFTDADSWIPAAFPGYGQALVFDAAYQPKPAYWAIHDLLQ